MPIPYYRDIVGQEEVIHHLTTLVEEDRLPHAILLAGEEGGEALPLALALARHILCEKKSGGGEACGHCSSCHRIDRGLEHSDLALVYPIVRQDEKSTSELYFKSFQKLVMEQKRFTEREWRTLMNAKNKQLQMTVAEAERLIHFASLRSFGGGHQVILIWMPEKMRQETANKLLKLLEEPPQGVIFIAVSHQPEALLSTIRSRLQRVNIPAIPEKKLVEHLIATGTPTAKAEEIGHLAQGNLYRAEQLLRGTESEDSFGAALDLLLLPTQRDPRLFLERATDLSKQDRPEVLALLEELPLVLREALALRYGDASVSYIPAHHRSGIERLSKELLPSLYPTLLEDLDAAQQEVRQNGSIKMILFDFLINTAQLYAQSQRVSRTK